MMRVTRNDRKFLTAVGVVPFSAPDPEPSNSLYFLRANGLALTRDNYLYVEYLGNPPEDTSELESELPDCLRNEEDDA